MEKRGLFRCIFMVSGVSDHVDLDLFIVSTVTDISDDWEIDPSARG